MAKYFIYGSTLLAIANAIRAKKGTTAKIDPADFESEILSIIGSDVEMQTFTVTNSNNEAESASFTMPSRYWFSQFIGSEYDTSGGAFVVANGAVTYNGYALKTSDGNSVTTKNLASGTFSYEGESVEVEPTTQTLTITNYNNENESYSFTMPYGYTYEQFVGSTYDTSGGRFSFENQTYVLFDGERVYGDDEMDYAPASVASGVIYYDGEAATTYELSGTWVFNETIEQPKAGSSYSVNFTSYNTSTMVLDRLYIAMTLYTDSFGNTSLAYVCDNGITKFVAYKFIYSEWQDDEFRTITFDGTQTVSEEFYTWFTANAKPTLSGTWTLNDYLKQPATNTSQEVRFLSYSDFNLDGIADPIMFERITFEEHTDGYVRMWYRSTSYGTSVFTFGVSSKVNPDRQELTFDGIQTVSKEFYEWFTANATQTA